MMDTIYKVLTPAGQFDAVFAEDEDTPRELFKSLYHIE
ncbi:hypothetical protein SAMN05216419_105611 [Nitrosomonas cryotolerans]|nr:hypothetical protein SAMN05216419_105611 [Nitrosomonas cryotolerans]